MLWKWIDNSAGETAVGDLAESRLHRSSKEGNYHGPLLKEYIAISENPVVSFRKWLSYSIEQ